MSAQPDEAPPLIEVVLSAVGDALYPVVASPAFPYGLMVALPVLIFALYRGAISERKPRKNVY